MMCFLACVQGEGGGGDVCAQAMCSSKTCPFRYLNFSWCNNFILSKDHTSNTAPTRAKIIPHLRVEPPKNHTLSSGPYLSSVNMRVNPSPPEVYSTQQLTKSTSIADRRLGSLVDLNRTRHEMLNMTRTFNGIPFDSTTVTLRFHGIGHG